MIFVLFSVWFGFFFSLVQGKTSFDSRYNIIDQSFWTMSDSAIWGFVAFKHNSIFFVGF